MACVNSGASAAEAVDIVYKLMGSSSIFEQHPIERCFRDVHAATQHMAVSWKRLEVAGRVLLGQEPRGLI